MLIDILFKNLCQSFCQGSRSKKSGVNITINIMTSKILIFFIKSLSHFYFIVNVFLGTILNTDISKLEWNFSVENHMRCICTTIHYIYFGNNSKSSCSFRIPFTSQVKTLRSCHICVSRNDCKNDCPILTTISFCHFSCDLFNILNLITHRDFGDTREINQSQIGTFVWIDCKFKSLINYSLIATCYFISLWFNSCPNLVEVKVFLLLINIFKDSVRLSGGYIKIHLRLFKWTIRSSRGLLVTTPDPLGRKSRPTMFSKSEDFPLDWVPASKKMYLKQRFLVIRCAHEDLHPWSYRWGWWAYADCRREACLFVPLSTFLIIYQINIIYGLGKHQNVVPGT